MSLDTVLERIATLSALAAPVLTGSDPVRSSAASSSSAFSEVFRRVSGSEDTSESHYAVEIDAAARRYGVDPALVRAVIQQESGFDPKATSPAGAQGLMQLMPATARGLGVDDPYDAAQSIDAGTRYLAGQLRRFGGDVRLALAAYNAGPGAVERFGGIPPYAETQRYVQSVLAHYEEAA